MSATKLESFISSVCSLTHTLATSLVTFVVFVKIFICNVFRNYIGKSICSFYGFGVVEERNKKKVLFRIGEEDYILVIPKRKYRQPIHASDKQGNDISSLISKLAGPNKDFYLSSTLVTPKLLGYNEEIEITLDNEPIKVDSSRVISSIID